MPNRAPRVEHGLPAHLQCSRDVCADDEVGAVQLGRHPPIVVGEGESQRAQAEARHESAEPDMPAGVRIPLREHDDGPPRSPRGAAGREVPGIDQVVVRVRRGERAREDQCELAAVPVRRRLGSIVRGRRSSEEPVRVGQRGCRPVANDLGRIATCAGGLVSDPVESPFKRTNHPVGVSRGELSLPAVEEGPQHVVEHDGAGTEGRASPGVDHGQPA
jgi:hypothetical protein